MSRSDDDPRSAISRQLLILGATAGLCFLPVPARPQAATPKNPFGERLVVDLVQVDVVVTDRKGKPVTGLTRDDFLLDEDGVPVEITHFEEHRPSTAPPPDVEPAPSAAVTTPPEELAAEPAGGGTEPRLTAVLFDQRNMVGADRNRILPDLETFLAGRLAAGDRVLIASYGLRLETLTGLIRDPEEVTAALEDVAHQVALGPQQAAERISAYRELKETYDLYAQVASGPTGEPCVDDIDALEGVMRRWADHQRRETAVSLAGLENLVIALAGFPGAADLFYVSDGTPFRPGLDLFRFLADVCPNYEAGAARAAQDYDSRWRLEGIAALANANRITLHALEAAGLQGFDRDVELSSRRFSPSALTSRTRIANQQQSLVLLADLTGGSAVLNANRMEEDLERIEAEQAVGYTLGFQPGHQPDGMRHRIFVSLAAPENRRLRLRYRRSYVDKPYEQSLAERTFGALLLGLEKNPLGIRITTDPAELDDAGALQVPVRITVPLDRLQTASLGEGPEAMIRVVIAVRDPRETAGPIRQKMIKIPVRELPGLHSIVVEIELEEGPQLIAVGVSDELGTEASFLRHAFEVQPPGGGSTGDPEGASAP